MDGAPTYRCEIVNVATGESRAYGGSDAYQDGIDFWWREGNMACDCNRMMEWLRAAGEYDEERDLPACPCGHGGFRVAELILSDGRRIPIDGATP